MKKRSMYFLFHKQGTIDLILNDDDNQKNEVLNLSQIKTSLS